MKEYIYDVSGDWPGNAFLAAGKTNILFDSGVACCGDMLVKHIETVLRGECKSIYSTPRENDFG